MIARSSEYACARMVGVPTAVVAYQWRTDAGVMSRKFTSAKVSRM